MECCPEYTGCLADADCICALDCYLGGLPTEDCIAMCGITVAAVSLFNCASAGCSDVCT